MAPSKLFDMNAQQPVDPRQLILPRVDFSTRLCLLCGGRAEAFRAADLPQTALSRFLWGRLSYHGLQDIARRQGLDDQHCWTSLAGVSICKTEQPRPVRK